MSNKAGSISQQLRSFGVNAQSHRCGRERHQRRASWIIVRTAMLAATLSCCSGTFDGSSDSGADGSDGNGTVLPLAAVMESSETSLTLLTKAENRLRDECMEARGFEHVTPIHFDTRIFNLDQRYGNRTHDWAAENGYRPMNFASLIESIGLTDPGPVPSADYQKAMFGNSVLQADGSQAPDGTGCESMAATEIYGGPERRYSFDGWGDLLELDSTSYERTMASSTVVAAEAEWAKCMTSAGFDYSSPQEPMFEFPTPFDDPIALDTRPSDAEIKTAVADASCRDEGHLQEIYIEVESEVQRKLLDEHVAAVLAVEEQMSAAIERAKQVLDK
jgi:hypothetical protein